MDRRAQAVLPRLQSEIESDLTDNLGAQLAAVRKALTEHAAKPAQFTRNVARQTLTDPWTGLAALEQAGLLAADAADSGVDGLAGVIDVLEAGVDRTGEPFTPLAFPITLALRHLSPQDREFLFTQAQVIAEHFIPQITPPAHVPQAEAQTRFATLVAQQVDYASLISAAQRLVRLGNHKFLKQVETAFQGRKPISQTVPGITGDVLLLHQTSYGLIIVGGTGPNTYALEKGAALIIDLGGNDTYRGLAGASPNTDLGNSVVIDLRGNDTYHTLPLGVATGRLGVGLLIDHEGNDTYHLAPGTGGAGFAGLGILYDGSGHDVYEGTRFTQGAAFGGLGLLIDGAGDDRHTSFGYALGFGAPLGVGAVVDLAGNDTYECGGKYPSAYNAADAPEAKPKDAAFQYDCFGLGTGSGFRILAKPPGHAGLNLGGGWGLLLDAGGEDRYRSDNFSQGHGYYFGAGLALDLFGDDDHQADRYGQGSAAHFGIGLMIDYQGKDRYGSKGPFYNGGAAWDGSVAMAVDGALTSDLYDLPASTGLGIADHGGWGLFIEEGGADQYAIKRGLGAGSENSLGAFFDLEGRDDYTSVPPPRPGAHPERLNRKTYLENAGSLFIDR